MTEQEKQQLLLKDLCGRLPYGVKIMFSNNGFRWDWEQTLSDITKCDDGEYVINGWGIHGIKPYLRPMSSMTKEEEKEFIKFRWTTRDGEPRMYEWCDYANAHHFDYRGLIPMGLALEAKEGMYKIE